jgi:tetratricopeptide (TPR) repeat protein
MPSASSRLVEAFDPRVLAFQTSTFSLAEDLDWLDRLRELRAPVGVILHSTRILEVLCRQSGEQVGLATPRDGLNNVMRLLMDYQHLPKDTYRLLDRLREVGNKARHVLGRLTFADAEQGYAVLLRGLQWYFCEFQEGLKLKCLGVHNQPLDALLPSDLITLLTMLETDNLNEQGFLDCLGLERRHCPVLQSPLLAAVLAERLLDGNRPNEAQIILSAALARFPDDVRLRQLQGLTWSRTGRLEDACAYLEAIDPTDSAADEETQGILAGACKRRAAADPERRTEWLTRCHERYDRGWRSSQERNTYLGVNAAATGLWLGLPDQGTAEARKVRNLLETRRLNLEKADGQPPRFLNCWDQLTLAEAHLLLRDWETARQSYRTARERFPNQKKALEVAREQANADLVALDRADLVEGFFS